MSDDPLLRLLALVCRELSAEDARIEIGGRPPAVDGRHLWVPLGAHRRLVAVFAEPPAEPEGQCTRLAALAEAFSETAKAAGPAVAVTRQPALNDALAGLCERAGACCAVVVDGASPVIWGRSHAELDLAGDVDRWLAAAGALGQAAALLGDGPKLVAVDLDEVKARLHGAQQTEAAAELAQVADAWELSPEAFARWARGGLALVALREHLKGLPPSQLGALRLVHQGRDGSWYARGVATVYQLVLCFDGPLSEPRVEGVVRRAAPLLDKLIAALPPLDPPPLRGLRLLRTD